MTILERLQSLFTSSETKRLMADADAQLKAASDVMKKTWDDPVMRQKTIDAMNRTMKVMNGEGRPGGIKVSNPSPIKISEAIKAPSIGPIKI